MKWLYFVQKGLRGLAVLWGSFTLVFIIFMAIPDPARQLAGQQADAELIADMRTKFGLDRPWHERYLRALTQLSPLGQTKSGWGLRTPSLGESFIRQESVTALLLNAFPGTAILAFASLILALTMGIPMGLLATRNPGGLFDRIVVGGSVVGMSAPSFFAAVLIGYLCAVELGTVTGLPLTGSLWDLNDHGERVVCFRHLVLPALTLGIRPLAVLAQLTRGAASDVLAMPHVKTARAFGASEWEILRCHVLRNAMNPVLTSASGWLAQLLAGAVFVEFVFGWKGLGFLLFDALEQQDLPLVMGGVLVVSFVFVCVNAMTDVAYRWLDPRAAQA